MSVIAAAARRLACLAGSVDAWIGKPIAASGLKYFELSFCISPNIVLFAMFD
jgi:hypothetical protein